MAAPQEIIVDPDGDVIFICPELPHNTERIRVSSAILIAASSVFHAMLSKRYAEGTALAENSTVDIPLPDEDSKTMALLCRIVHMQDDVPFSLEPRDIYSLALLADKYGCRGPLRVLGHGWIKEQLPGNSAQDSAYMLASAWLLQSNALIRTLSEELVWHYVTPTSQINEAGAVLPDYISSTIDSKRQENKSRLAAIVDRHIAEYTRRSTHCGDDCTVLKTVLGQFMLHMANKKVLSATHFEDTSLATLYRRFDDLIDYRMLSNRLNIQRCSMSGCLYHLYLTDSLPSVYRVSVRMQDKAYLVETELLNWFKGWKV